MDYKLSRPNYRLKVSVLPTTSYSLQHSHKLSFSASFSALVTSHFATYIRSSLQPTHTDWQPVRLAAYTTTYPYSARLLCCAPFSALNILRTSTQLSWSIYDPTTHLRQNFVHTIQYPYTSTISDTVCDMAHHTFVVNTVTTTGRASTSHFAQQKL